jgi:hypothetical protein
MLLTAAFNNVRQRVGGGRSESADSSLSGGEAREPRPLLLDEGQSPEEEEEEERVENKKRM